MRYIKRTIDTTLEEWKNSTQRKPLLLRGARQVGKSSTVRELSKKFTHFVEVNFESEKEVRTFFQGNLNPQQICDRLSLYYETPIIPRETLLFLDEIQSCKPAIESLRFFYEKYPELHVIAAGSLLEFALTDLSSFGVGRVRSAFIYPLSFNEYLSAIGMDMLLDAKKKADIQHPLDTIFHKKLNEHLKQFLILGGMPEVIATYVETHSMLQCMQVIDDLRISFQDDFAKYKENVPTLRIREVFDSIAEQTGGKFVYSKASQESNYRQIKEAVNLLTMAGLAIPVYRTSANGIPVGAGINSSFFKLFLLDTGMFQRMVHLDSAQLLTAEDWENVNKGAIAEQFAALELLKAAPAYQKSQLYYWQRESKNSNAEVDYILQQDQHIIPLEIKSGTKGSMHSLHLFMEEKQPPYGVRSSLENFGQYNNICLCPLYALGDKFHAV